MVYYSALHYASKAEKSALSAATYAAQLKNATFGNIGDIKYSCRNVAPNGGVWCDGSEYTQAQFPDFYTMLVNGDIPSTTYENYTAELTANGVCGRFALDTANTKFRVPTLADAFFSSAVASNIGDYIGAKLAASSGTLTSGGVKYRPYVMLYVAAVEASTAQAAEFITALDGKADKNSAAPVYQEAQSFEGTVINLLPNIVRYFGTATSGASYTVNTANLAPENRNITFELILNMPSVVSFSLANITTNWITKEAPDLSEAGMHWFAFTSTDNGATWRGSYEGVFAS